MLMWHFSGCLLAPGACASRNACPSAQCSSPAARRHAQLCGRLEPHAHCPSNTAPHFTSPNAPLQAGAMTGFVAAFTEGPIDFYKSQIQVQIIRSKMSPDYKRECGKAEARGRVCLGAQGWEAERG